MKKRKLIHDVHPDKSLGGVQSQDEQIKQAHDEYSARTLPSDVMVNELYGRGVTIRQIFARYYELDAQADACSLTVEDAELAVEPHKPQEERPF